MQSRVVETDRGAAGQWRGRRILLALVLVTLLPTIAALLLHWSGWQPQGRNLGFGEILNPARPLPTVALSPAENTAMPFSALRGKWLLLTMLDRGCDEGCRTTLYAMQQIRLAQGDHMRRVERVLIADERQKGELARIANDYRGMYLYFSDRRTLSELSRALLSPEPAGSMRMFIVDPNGNLVMRYAPTANPSGVSKDLARLLRLSRVD